MIHGKIRCLAIGLAFVLLPGHGQQESKIKIDPSLFICLKECRNIIDAVGDKIWKGWEFSQTPILFYRPQVQDVLIEFPHQPQGFETLSGFNPLIEEIIYYRDGGTYITYDGQNTSKEIEGIKTLVVADTFSNQRNSIRGVVLNESREFVQKWLEDWNFLPDPYQIIQLILHEAFHVFQEKMAPEKSPDELAAMNYPLLDVFNNSFWSLEGAVLSDALLAQGQEAKVEKIKEFIAVRESRRAKLKSELADYEDLMEYKEGIAKYIELVFIKNSRGLEPEKQLFFVPGFYGYGKYMDIKMEKEIRKIKDIVSGAINLTGNKFGVGLLRFRLYSSGAAVALLLDEMGVDWKKDIFKDKTLLFDQLKRVFSMSDDEIFQCVSRAKKEYDYVGIEETKKQFENEGNRRLEEKLKSILETNDNLVIIDYSDLGSRLGLSFSPFGVTKVGENSAIYDLVPLMGRFENSATFKFNQMIPVIIDKGKKEIQFAAKTAASDFMSQKGNEIKVREFVLTGCRFEIKRDRNTIYIKLFK